MKNARLTVYENFRNCYLFIYVSLNTELAVNWLENDEGKSERGPNT